MEGGAWMCYWPIPWWSWGARAQDRNSPVCGGEATAVGLQRWSLSGISLPPSVGLGLIHMSEVRCKGSERTLSECPSLHGSPNGCQHENDAAVRCNVPNMGFQNQVSSGLGMSSGWGLGKPSDSPRTPHGARGRGWREAANASALGPAGLAWEPA